MSDGRRTFIRMIGGGVTSAFGGLLARRAAAQGHGGHSDAGTAAPAAAPAAQPTLPGQRSQGDGMTGMDHGTMPPAGAMKGHGGMAMAAPAPLPKGAPPKDSPLYKRFAFELKVVQHEIVPGWVAHMMGYAGRVPGPTIRVNEGDWVWVDFTNASDEMHTIHWHGLILDYRHDGVPYIGQDPIMRGEKYTYVFQAKPYGTHFYHCHFGTSMHMQSGMYGAIIVERPDDPIRKLYPYTRDIILILSSIDTVFVREQMNTMFARMRQRDLLMSRGALDLKTQNRFATLKDLVAAVKDGYVPPYMRSRNAPRIPDPNFFLMNGRAYPGTDPIRVREGEWVRIRFVNAGNVIHNMHIHGHDFLHVCEDGAPLPAPVQLNTVTVAPGKTQDVVFLADNPGFWMLHDHDVTHTVNNGVYPGGVMTHIEYEGFKGTYSPSVSLDE